MNSRLTRVAAISACCGLFQASAWSTDHPTHDTGFLQPGRVSKISQHLPHLRILIYIDQVEHHPIANGGANYVQYWIKWEFESLVATPIPLEMPSWPLFLGPGGAPEFEGRRIVYKGEVPNGCNSDVDLQLHLTVHTSPDAEETYNDHITGHGYYNVYVPIRVNETENEASFDFVFRGHAEAFCVSKL